MRRSIRALAHAVALTLALAPLARADGEKDLKKGIAAGDRALVVKALEALGGEDSEKAAKTILTIALQVDELNKAFKPEDTNAIFDAAKHALAGMTDKKALDFVYKNASKNKDHRARIVLLEVCGVKGEAGAEEALLEGLADKHATVAGTAARLLGAKQKLHDAKKAVPALIDLLAKVETDRREPWQDVLTALCRLSGEQIDNAQDFRGWWQVKADTFEPSKATGEGMSATVRREAPKLFGKEVLSKKVVFILDVSGSMEIKDPVDEQGRRGKWVDPKNPDYHKIPVERMRMYRLKEAMVALIKDLPEDTQFTIVTFSSEIRTWQAKLVPCNAKNKGDAIDFAKGMTPQGFTWTDTAIEEAFKILDANTFYLFSDGIPQRGSGQHIDRQEILEKVRQLNRTRKVKIYTNGFGEADRAFMDQLAKENGGDFTPVD
jgi:hypothetical protein